ncbi:MAG: phosphotransferase [Clostridiales bacterium]|nr:phosphotransferase [Clostridiales bacterium]
MSKRYFPEKIDQIFFGAEKITAEPYGSGHIHDTYLVEVEGKKEKYILQRMNSHVFPNGKIVMENIIQVTEFLREKMRNTGRDLSREVLSVIPTAQAEPYYVDEDGKYWRNYLFIQDTDTIQLPEKAQQFYEAAKAFGDFQMLLIDYPAHTLHETIKDFHNTPVRVAQLEEAIQKADPKRLEKAADEIAFAKKRYEKADILVKKLESGELPLRVTHNDTKLNNVLMDKATGKGICVIDLDTVMPGLTAYDFGDAIRFGANTAEEGEDDVTKVSLNLDFYEAFTKGFLEKTADVLSEEEIASLPLGAMIITYEIGLRFLADYLNGDVYFKIHHPEENRIRARNQFALMKDMEDKMDQMQGMMDKYSKG